MQLIFELKNYVDAVGDVNYSIISNEFETGENPLNVKDIKNQLVSLTLPHIIMNYVSLLARRIINHSFDYNYVQDPEGDQRIFLLNSYTEPRQQIICEVCI